MQVTRCPQGISTQKDADLFGQMALPNPTTYHTYFDDFDSYIAADWTVTETQAGATQALTDADGGVFALVNSATDDDLNAVQKVGESFLFEAGKETFFKARFKIDDATQSDLVVGLQITDTTPLAVTDGIYFIKADASTTLNLTVIKDSTSTVTSVTTLADDTFVNVGFHYNGVSNIGIYVNDVLVGNSVTTNLPDDEELTVSIAVQNGEGVAKELYVDYVFVAKRR